MTPSHEMGYIVAGTLRGWRPGSGRCPRRCRQESSDQRRGVHAELGHDHGHCQRMGDGTGRRFRVAARHAGGRQPRSRARAAGCQPWRAPPCAWPAAVRAPDGPIPRGETMRRASRSRTRWRCVDVRSAASSASAAGHCGLGESRPGPAAGGCRRRADQEPTAPIPGTGDGRVLGDYLRGPAGDDVTAQRSPPGRAN